MQRKTEKNDEKHIESPIEHVYARRLVEQSPVEALSLLVRALSLLEKARRHLVRPAKTAFA